MLVTNFSIAVEAHRADEVRDKLVNTYGVMITREFVFEEKFCWDERVERIYFECYVPYSRFDGVTCYLNTVYDGTAVLTY